MRCAAALSRWIVPLVFVAGCGQNLERPLQKTESGAGGGVDIGGDPGATSPTPHAPAGVGPGSLSIDPNAPPPITGGTLLVTHDGSRVIASDPDRDQVFVVDLAGANVTPLALAVGSQPGRIAEDAAGRIHVALRGGAVVTIDPAEPRITEWRSICSAPRGIAYDSTTDSIFVACATGELIGLPAGGGAATSTAIVERDLRDILIQRGQISVTSFRSSELLTVAKDGSVLSRARPGCANFNSEVFAPEVAWRTVQTPDGTVIMSHQRFTLGQIAFYAPEDQNTGACQKSVVHSAVTSFAADRLAPVSSPAIADAVLPVDIAVSDDGARVAIANAGTKDGGASVLVMDTPTPNNVTGECVSGAELHSPGQVVALAFRGSGTLIAQSREPAALFIYQGLAGVPLTIPLAMSSVLDTGHQIFHTDPGGGIACASCHPEGGDDGHTWDFQMSGPRRTLNLRGTLEGTAPYHWGGESKDMPSLIDDVFVGRMHGRQLSSEDMTALGSWLISMAPPPPRLITDVASVVRGRALFEGSAGCIACHSGPKLTNNATLDVGTGEKLQVPSLVGVGWHLPLLHDGCAQTIEERLTTCATPQHGSTSALSKTDIADLVSFLESL
jgi:hypothetical protein